jgi:hypothetical protein
MRVAWLNNREFQTQFPLKKLNDWWEEKTLILVKQIKRSTIARACNADRDPSRGIAGQKPREGSAGDPSIVLAAVDARNPCAGCASCERLGRACSSKRRIGCLIIDDGPRQSGGAKLVLMRGVQRSGRGRGKGIESVVRTDLDSFDPRRSPRNS